MFLPTMYPTLPTENPTSFPTEECWTDPNAFHRASVSGRPPLFQSTLWSRRIVISADLGGILTILGGFWLDFGVLEAFWEVFVHFAPFPTVFFREISRVLGDFHLYNG